MTEEVKKFFEKFNQDSAKMKEQMPDTVNAFSGMFTKIMKEGALSVREKELIAMGIGVATRCKPCIRLHTKKCLKSGASKEQVLEAAAVAVMMGGGPVFTHLPVVIDTLEAMEG